jgi:uncharacterized membrane-anchored protein
MLIAGTLGTAIGDFGSFDSKLGTLYASLIEGAVLLTLILYGFRGALAGLWYYWISVVAVRAAGTSFGDFLVHDAFGLALSTFITGTVFIAFLLIWREAARDRMRSSDAM